MSADTIVMRHGDYYEGNKPILDTGLTEIGKGKVVQSVVEMMENSGNIHQYGDIIQIISSPTKRTVETANIVADELQNYGLEFHHSNRKVVVIDQLTEQKENETWDQASGRLKKVLRRLSTLQDKEYYIVLVTHKALTSDLCRLILGGNKKGLEPAEFISLKVNDGQISAWVNNESINIDL